MSQIEAPSTAGPAPRPASEADWPAPAYGWYVVLVLFIAAVVSYLDRQMIALLVEDIKADFGLSDFQIGLLQGPPFGLFYALMALPIALLADRYNRRNIIAAGVAFWSMATAACGLTGSFVQLFVARACVAVGEASLNPAGFSIISDYFDRRRRSLALSVFGMGTLSGIGIAMIIGGAVLAFAARLDGVQFWLVGELRPWQFAFLVVGIPGLLLALLVLTIREPLRRGALADHGAGGGAADIQEFTAFVREHAKTFLALFGGFTLLAFMAYANFAWVPAFFMRTFSWPAAVAGPVYGVVVAVFGTLGALFGGWLANWLAERGHSDAPFRAIFLCTIPLAPFAILAFAVAPNGWWAMALYAPWQFCSAAPSGLGPSAMMALAPNQMRAKTTSVYFFCLNLVGVTLGSTSVGFLTTHVFQDESQVRYALMIVSCVAAPVALLLISWGMRHYRASVAAVEAMTSASS